MHHVSIPLLWFGSSCDVTDTVWVLHAAAAILLPIIPHPNAIISNALDYILLIVESSDPNLSWVALS